MDITLEFGQCSDNAPVMTCHFCGKERQVKFMADLYPFADASSHMSLAACSAECRDNLLNIPKENLNLALLVMADDIATQCGLRFNREWVEFLDEMLSDHDKKKNG